VSSLRALRFALGILLGAIAPIPRDAIIVSPQDKDGESVKKMAKGGSASSRADGIASRGKTNCKMY